MSSYTEIFTATVPVVDGCLAPAVKAWFLEAGHPVLQEGDRVMVAEGDVWDAFTGERVRTGDVELRFRFSDKAFAMMFKLTWHAV